MSYLFEEFLPEEPDFHISQFETYDQLKLRERFSSLQERNEIDLLFFDPNEPNSHQEIKLHTIDRELEAKEPQLTNIFMQEMLRNLKLDAPNEKNKSRYISNTERRYDNGVRSIVFTIKKKDQTFVPVYSETETDGATPHTMSLLSYDTFERTVAHYRDLDEYRAKVAKKLGMSVNALLNYNVDDLKDFICTHEDIRHS